MQNLPSQPLGIKEILQKLNTHGLFTNTDDEHVIRVTDATRQNFVNLVLSPATFTCGISYHKNSEILANTIKEMFGQDSDAAFLQSCGISL